MVRESLAVGILLLYNVSVSGNAQPLVELTIKERASVDRDAEPVTSGIPLPIGRVKNTNDLQMLDHEGNQLNVAIEAVNRWWKSDSLKWIHLTFQTSLPADSEQKFTIVKKPAVPAASRSRIQVEESEAWIEVNTGTLLFSVRKSGFNGIDEAWLGEDQLLKSHQGGLVMKAGETIYRSSLDKTSRVEIEKQTSRTHDLLYLKQTWFLQEPP